MAQLPSVTDFLDFVAYDQTSSNHELLEKAGVPWIRVMHSSIPLGKWDEKRWVSGWTSVDRTKTRLQELAENKGLVNLVGFTSGSEPHISPEYRYTGHTEREVLELGTGRSALAFGDWLKSLYGDDSPSKDSNRDGITFVKDFGVSAEKWEEVGEAMPGGLSKNDFLFTLYKEHIVTEAIEGIDSALANDGELSVTSRLLSPQYKPNFGQSLRQLRLPSQALGVTYYNNLSMAADPSQSQAMFAHDRLYKSEKKFTESFRLRPPFRTGGKVVGVFGPFSGSGVFTSQIEGKFPEGPPLVIHVEQISQRSPVSEEVISSATYEVGSGGSIPAELGLQPSSSAWFLRISCWVKGGRGNSSQKVFLESPWVRLSDGSIQEVVGAYSAGLIGVFPGDKDGTFVEIGASTKSYEPSITGFRGNYIYNIAKRRDLRVVYNEFQTGDPVGNTTGNLYRGVINELQYKPAVINWFCYAGGDPALKFSWMDINYLATDLAALRGQLELIRPYEKIERARQKIGVFIPPAAPSPVGDDIVDAIGARGSLSLQLSDFEIDVLLTDQLDAYEEYDNILLVLGFVDGKTDRFLSKFLSKIPSSKHVLVLCASSELYTAPGERNSPNYKRSLRDVLPISPDGGGLDEVAVPVNAGVVNLRIGKTIHRNASFVNGQEIVVNGRVVGWRDDNYMVLAGLPLSGLDHIINSFFGIGPAAIQHFGILKIINADSVAAMEGLYSISPQATLSLADGYIGYDLARRSPIVGKAIGDTAVYIFSADSLRVVDAGTCRVNSAIHQDGRAEIQLALPTRSFEGDAKPELTIYSRERPAVSMDGQMIEVRKIGGGFYKASVDQSGVYLIGKP